MPGVVFCYIGSVYLFGCVCDVVCDDIMVFVYTSQAIEDALQCMDNCKEQMKNDNDGRIGALSKDSDMSMEVAQQQMLLRLYETTHNEAEAEKNRKRADMAIKLRRKRMQKQTNSLKNAIASNENTRVQEIVQSLLEKDTHYFAVSERGKICADCSNMTYFKVLKLKSSAVVNSSQNRVMTF